MAELVWMSGDPTIVLAALSAAPRVCRALDDLSRHRPTASSLLVVLPTRHLDDTLARAVQSLGSEYANGIGVLPVFEGQLSLKLLDSDVGKPLDSLTWAAISAHETSAPLGNGVRAISSPPTIAHRLKNGPPIDVFAGVLNGRQTFIHLDADFLLHPGIPARICQSPNIISCLDAQVEHWLIQSCHSPFAWNDFGDYLTVPLALTKNPYAKSILVSTRVQTYIPRLLALYAEMALDGCAMGLIAHALNAAALRHGCDTQPFLLIGNPDTRIVDRPRTSGTYAPPQHDAADAAEAISQVVNHLKNLSVLVDGQYLNFHAALDTSKEFRALVHKIRGEFNHRRETLRSYSPKSKSLVDRWDSLATSDDFRLHNVVSALRRAWINGIGYYYQCSILC